MRISMDKLLEVLIFFFVPKIDIIEFERIEDKKIDINKMGL